MSGLPERVVKYNIGVFVDDEAPIVQLEKQMLERLGYQTSIFTSSREALKAFKTDPSRFDLVITDLIGAASGYVAFLSETGEENEVLFFEVGGLPCDVDSELPMPIRGLRAEAYHSNKAVCHNDFKT